MILNAGYLLVGIPLMQRRLLPPSDKWRWHREDFAIPTAAAGAMALLCRWAMPKDLGKLGETSVLLAAAASVMFTAAMAAPLVRRQIGRHLAAEIRFFSAKTAA